MTKASTWTPAVPFDLETASPQTLADAIARLRDWSAKQPPLGPLTLATGWHDITPQTAEELLRRNEANRKVSLATVRKYAHSMLINDWHQTGQPIIFNENGKMEDAQHRLYACYFSGASFRTFVVANTPYNPNTFAYIDDVKPRSAADALYTSGINGMSTHLAGAVKLAIKYDHKAMGVLGQPRGRDPDHREVLDYQREHMALHDTAEIVQANFQKALAIINSKPVAFFFAYRVMEQWGYETLEEFLDPLGSGAMLEDGSPILGLRNRMTKPGAKEELKVGIRLALVMKAFAFHLAEKKLPKMGLYVRDNEEFPRFETMTSSAAVADAA